MSDLISRQAAIDAVRSYYDEFDERDESIEERIEQLPSAQAEPKWIPCSERLPEEYGKYRITWTTSDAPSKRFIGIEEYAVTRVWDDERNTFKGEWLLDAYIESHADVKVIAWRPLEEPYKGEQE